MSLKNVLLIGSSGILAPHLIKSLSSSPNISLTVLSRSRPTTSTKNAEFITLPTPYKGEDLTTVFRGQDAIIDLLPPGQFDFHKIVIDLSIQEGVKRYIPPDFGLRSDNDTLAERSPVVAMKKRVREYAQTKEVDGLTWTSVVCGGFLDSGLTGGFLGFSIKDKTARLYDEGNGQMDLTLLSDVGKAIVSIIEHPEETKNRYVYINTFLASQADILTVLRDQHGDFNVTHVAAIEASKEGATKLKKGDFSGVKDSLLGSLLSGITGANGEGKDNEFLLGRKTEPISGLRKAVKSISERQML